MAEALKAIAVVLDKVPMSDECRTLRRDLERCREALEKRHEALLKHRASRYTTWYELALVGYVTFDRDGHVRAVNRAAAGLLGRDSADLVGESFASLLAGGGGDDYHEHLRKVFARPEPTDAEPESIELRAQTPDEVRELRLVSRLLPEEGGSYCLSVVTDVTEQRAAECRSREDVRLRQAMLNALPAHIAVLDSDGRIVAVNEAWERFAREHAAPNELTSPSGLDYLASCEGLAGSDDAEAAIAAAARDGIMAVMRGDAPRFHLEYPCRLGQKERWYLMTVTPLDGPGGGAVVAHLDVTERVEAEQANRRRRDALADASRQSSVGILAGSLIHELSQPLTAANLYSEYIAVARQAASPDWSLVTEAMADLDTQIKRAVEIVDGLRGFLRSQESSPQLCDFDDLLDQSFGLVRMLAQEKRIDLRVHPPGETVLVLGNPVQIVQVMVNLLCNAIERIEHGRTQRRQIELTATPGDGRIRVAVRDTGPGLSSSQSGGIFSVLDRDKESGPGMGLAISRSLVEAHGGEFWAGISVPDGVVFQFTLPLAVEEHAN